MWAGRLIGTVLGYITFGIFGAILGFIIGGLFDRGLQNSRALGGFGQPSAEALEHVQAVFFKTVFSLMGHLAKADGRVSEEEVAHTEAFMAQLGMTADHRREAIALFQNGAATDFSLDNTLSEFMAVCGRHQNLRQMLLVYLIGVALADGTLDRTEEAVLGRVAEAVGYSRVAFEQLLSMIRAQDQFSRQHYNGTRPASASDIEAAYRALGVDRNANDRELKKAYRRLMSEFHPDKLMGQGVPEDMIKVATERSQEVQVAYDMIRKQRKAA